MKPERSLLALRSRAALEEQAAYTAWHLGHYTVAARYGLRAARHTTAAMTLARKELTK